ncbi:type II secretion system F family protein [Actinomycetota bacterium]
MRLLAALCAAVFVYLAVGYAIGYAPKIRWRASRRPTHMSKRQLWLIQAGLNVSPLRFWAVSIVLGLVALLVASGISQAFWVAAPPAVVVMLIPRWFYERRRLQRLSAVKRAWPDGLRHLVAAVRSGVSLPLALEDLAANGPNAIQEALARFPTLAKVFGVPAALEAVRDELADPTTDRVIEVLLVAHERGGSIVPEILQDLAVSTTRDLRTVEEIRSESLEQRLSARIVFAVPWLVLLLMTARDGPYRVFYRSAGGTIVIFVGAVLSVFGWWAVSRLGREPIEQRVFGSTVAEVRR